VWPGVALWIVPDDENAEKLQKVMQIKRGPSLAQASYPTFHPHITLVSPPVSLEDHLASIKACVAKYRALSLPICRFKSVDIGNYYYRSVYVAIQPTLELLDMHKYFHDILRIEPITPAFPHLSLCYIDDADAENGERQAFYDTLKDAGELRAIKKDGEVEGVSLNCGSNTQEEWIDHFKASEIWAVLCEGPVEGWKVIQKFSLEQE